MALCVCKEGMRERERQRERRPAKQGKGAKKRKWVRAIGEYRGRETVGI